LVRLDVGHDVHDLRIALLLRGCFHLLGCASAGRQGAAPWLMVSQWLLAASAYGGDGVDPRIRNQFRIGTDSQPPGSRRAVSIFWYMDRDRLISV
jgi:hypothetical protein